MRKFIFSILLASAAASPALAQDHGRWQQESEKSDRAEAREQVHEQRQEQREQRQEQREQRQEQRVQQQPQLESRREQWQGGNFGGREQSQAQEQQQRQGRGGWDGRRRDDTQQQAVQQQVEQQRRFDGRSGGNWSGERRTWTGGEAQQNQTNGGWARDRGSWSRDRDGDFRQRQVEQQSRDSSRWAQSGQRWSGQRYSGNWDRNWRNDRRYDWRRHRDRNRTIFHIGVYFDPFGYNYRPYNIGYRLQPFYFQQRYWIDPGMYGLPYPPPGTMWVRYWNDVLLVDTYSGEVVDVIRNFFW
jgi:Ni/Co efflux regulator RcnB